MTTQAEQLRMPWAAANAVIDEVRRFGDLNVETGGFLLSPESDRARITTIALAGEAGVTRQWGIFHIDGNAIEVLFAWCDEHQLHIPAQVHSHMANAFLSPTDKRDGFNVSGFVSSVVPFYAAPPPAPQAWGWWSFTGTEWKPITPPTMTDADVAVVVFDKEGVR